MGVRGVYEYFFDYMSAACKASSGSCRFISLGSGQCEIEIEIVKLMLAAGHKNFVLECLDINEAMLNRGRELAVAASVAPFLGVCRQ